MIARKRKIRVRRSPSRRNNSLPSAYDLWKKAGGGTDQYDKAEYLWLMHDHGLIIPRAPGDEEDK